MKFFKNNFIVRFIIALFLVGFLFGLIIYFTYKPNLTEYINQFKELIITSHNNSFLIYIIVLATLFISTLTIIGSPLILLYTFYEGLSISYTLCIFLSHSGIKGAIFYILFLILTKSIYILIMLYFSMLSIKFVKKIIEAFLNKDRDSLYSIITHHFLRFIIVLFVIIINGITVHFISTRIIKLFVFLLKA